MNFFKLKKCTLWNGCDKRRGTKLYITVDKWKKATTLSLFYKNNEVCQLTTELTNKKAVISFWIEMVCLCLSFIFFFFLYLSLSTVDRFFSELISRGAKINKTVFIACAFFSDAKRIKWLIENHYEIEQWAATLYFNLISFFFWFLLANLSFTIPICRSEISKMKI